MSETKHTPTPWKVVSDPHFDSGLVYTSIQPVNVDEDAMKALAMATGEYHVCRMSHTAAPWRFNYHRANAAFIVEAVNSHASLVEENRRLRGLIRWAHDTLWEINTSNYDHDEVCKLNDASVEVILGIAPELGETHGHTAEWWAARSALTSEQPVDGGKQGEA